MANFETSNTGTWFYFDPEHPESGGVCLRLLTAEKTKSIEKMVTTVEKIMVEGQLAEKKKVNEKLESELIFDYCIVDWNEVQIDGQKAECTIANKARIMKSIDFARFVNQSLKVLAASNKAIQEVVLKNSETILNGSTQNQTAETVD